MIGVDEAGRGAWAGALLAAAVDLPHADLDYLLADSKSLSPKKRQEIANLLLADERIKIAYGEVSSAFIDQFGLTLAQEAVMFSAVQKLKPKPQTSIIVDGKINYLRKFYKRSQAVIKADGLYPAVMAASILAKVKRDQKLRQLGQRFPNYGFAEHKGYGTSQHRQALSRFGALNKVHRFSYKPLQAFTK